MSSAVAELDGILQSMLNLKPPGVTGSKINSITSLCAANVQSESVLIQKIYTHFKKTPGTHKLGVLYVVDSVTRSWVDQAKKAGQSTGGGPDGTAAAGVARVTELLPVLMNDILSSAPEDQKVKIKKLLEIWERSNTFPAAMMSSFKDKINQPAPKSTTPTDSPTPGFIPLGQQGTNQQQSMAPSSAPQQDTSAILEALKNMAKQTPANQTASAPAPASLNNFLGAQNGNLQPTSTVNQGPSAANSQAVNPLGALFAGMSNGAQGQNTANVPQNQNPLAALLSQSQAQPQAQAPALPNMPPGSAPVGQDAQAQLQVLQLLAAQGVPPDQWATALQLLSMQGGASGQAFPASQANNWGQGAGSSRDREGYRSPPNQNAYRRRSRSPAYDRRRDASPRRRRESPPGDAYRDNRRGNDYRQRSPPGRRRRSPSPPKSDPSLPPPGPRNLQLDRSLPPGTIKVMSRTLFVGGVTSSEAHLKGLFAKFGIVQTCIVNVDKRHAFVKMLTRPDAQRARDGMEDYRDNGTQLRTKWGVGFGPRDCSDYQTGISIIPIDRLTDADRKWMVTAEYGGTGGAAIAAGMVVEEPDIEIGAGVSSKAMSRRIATDQGGRQGPQSSRTGRFPDRKNDRFDDRQNNNDRPSSSGNNAPAPNMPFPFPAMPNGMPMLPPGFPYAFPQQNK